MKTLIGLALLAVVIYVAKTLNQEYRKVEKESGPAPASSASSTPAPPASTLPGMSASLEPNLALARQQGAAGLKKFLTDFSYALQDPRRAEIELDYVVLLSRSDPVEAKRIFAGILARTPQNSPVYARVKRLESTFR